MHNYTKFCKIISISSQDIEQKGKYETNSVINQGPQLCYKLEKNDAWQS